MKAKFFLVIVLVLISTFFLPKSVFAQTSTIFFDDFTDSDGVDIVTHNNNWQLQSGSAAIQNNSLNANTYTRISLPNFVFLNQCSSVDLQFPLVNLVRLFVRQGGAIGHEYYTFINPGDNTFRLAWADVYSGDNYLDGEENVNPSAGWHNLKICAIGDDKIGPTHLTVYIDDILHLEANDYMTNYNLGYGGGNTAIIFQGLIDNFKLEEVDSEPQVNQLNGASINQGDIYTENGSFTDYDSYSWTATVDYDDGSGVEPLNLSSMNFALSHQYITVGVHNVVVSITDNQGATSTTSATVTVNQPQPITVTFTSSADTNVRSGQGNRNYGGGDFMRIQSSGDNRALVQFDQGQLQSSISGAVLSAKLRLTIVDNGNNWGSTGRTVDVHRLISDWLEGNGTESNKGTGVGSTWNCAIDSIISNTTKNCSGTTEWEMGQPNNPSVHPWVEIPTATQTITNNQTGIIEYDVTSDVVNFMNGTNTNYGWIIKKTNEAQTGSVNFGTKESMSIPQLVVIYQP